MSSYWYHGGEGGGCEGTDFSNSTGLGKAVSPASRPDLNGTYSTDAFTDEAVRLIENHDAERPLYMYIAYEAVHDAGGANVVRTPDGPGGCQAPLSIVNEYSSHVVSDTYKVQTAMLTSLDNGIARLVRALESKGMLEEAVFIVTSDNGGPLDHSFNAPLRCDIRVACLPPVRPAPTPMVRC